MGSADRHATRQLDVGDETRHRGRRSGSPRGGAAPVRVGQRGETLAGTTGPKVRIVVNGRSRIPDELTATTVREVKNVKSLALTRQLRDFVQFARETDRRLILVVRPDTRLSQPIQAAVDAGLMVLSLTLSDS